MHAWQTLSADGFLLHLRDHPDLMDEAPNTILAVYIDIRRNEEHCCLRCDGAAGVAYPAATDCGYRWLDLCDACSTWLILNATIDWPNV